MAHGGTSNSGGISKLEVGANKIGDSSHTYIHFRGTRVNSPKTHPIILDETT